MSNMDIYDSFRATPKEAQKEIAGGRLRGFTDINPMYRIQKLTEKFGPCGIGWYYEPVKKWIERAGDEIMAFVDINLFIKVGGEWSKPISGTGGSALYAMEKGGLKASDECFKMATTDAISVACKQLGIGADVYWKAGESKYSRAEPDNPVPASKLAETQKTSPAQVTVSDRPLTWQEQTEIICNVNRIKMDLFKDLFAALKQDGKFVNKTVDKLTPDEWQTLKPLIAAAVNATKPK
jgi:hypothetical protein